MEPAATRQTGGRRGQGDAQPHGFAPGLAQTELKGQQTEGFLQCLAAVQPAPGRVFDDMGVQGKADGVHRGLVSGGDGAADACVFNFLVNWYFLLSRQNRSEK